jgi:hypothetical protein
MSITFNSWPVFPMENNIWSHTGNPDLAAFTCDIWNLATTGGAPIRCDITDVNATDTPGETASRASRALVDHLFPQ